jgi:hypothetical protein
MTQVLELFDLASGKTLPGEAESRSRRLQLVVRALIASLICAALYGFAAGSTDLSLAIGNIYKMPMVVALSTAVALPVGLLTWKLMGAGNRASDLLLGLAAGTFTATLVLAALSPIVALYYHTSGYMGGTLALGAAVLAVVLGLFNFGRSVLSRRPAEVDISGVALPMVVLMGAQLAAMVQFIYIASPILPEVTVFDGGVDAILGDR